jgi:predicted RNase H-related nuclease YkuK (DUF458 family)
MRVRLRCSTTTLVHLRYQTNHAAKGVEKSKVVERCQGLQQKMQKEQQRLQQAAAKAGKGGGGEAGK